LGDSAGARSGRLREAKYSQYEKKDRAEPF
jgi:hypothetical protein